MQKVSSRGFSPREDMDSIQFREEILFPKFYQINLLLIFINFIFNFLGTPYIKNIYQFQVIFTIICALIFRWKEASVFITTLIFFVGQGKILSGYSPEYRIIFDIILLIAIIKSVVEHKKLVSIRRIPLILFFLFIFHFVWYFVNVFSVDSAGFFPALATAKYYIFPFFVFLMFLQNPYDLYSKNYSKFLLVVYILIFLSALLVLYQSIYTEKFLIKISENYLTLHNFKIFVGKDFRPFGTTHLPGGTSVLLFLCSAFLLIFPFKRNIKIKGRRIALLLIIGVCAGAMFVCQVRSAILKFFLILFFGSSIKFLVSRRKLRFLLTLPLILAFYFCAFKLINQNFIDKSLNLSKSKQRLETLFSYDVYIKSRSGSQLVLEVITKQLKENPFGIGLGMTSSFLPDFEKERKRRILKSENEYWTLDNLFVAIVMEQGWGAFMYILILLLSPIILFSMFIRAVQKKLTRESEVIGISLVVNIVILVGNWGAVGVLHNPESYFYWLWTAIGMSTYHQYVRKTKKGKSHIKENENNSSLLELEKNNQE